VFSPRQFSALSALQALSPKLNAEDTENCRRENGGKIKRNGTKKDEPEIEGLQTARR
jgi:hypothetical protein